MEKTLTATTQECCEQYWTSLGGSTPQSSSSTATYHLSWKLFKLDKADMRDTAGEVGMNSLTYSCGPLHMDEQRQDDQLEPTYNSSVLIQDVTFRTCWKWWTIEKGGRRGSGCLYWWHDMMICLHSFKYSCSILTIYTQLSYLLTPPLGQDMTQGQFFKRSLTGLNSEFSFSKTSCLTKTEEPRLPYYLPTAGGGIIGFIPFPRVLVLCEMQSASSRIWTCVAVSISCNNTHYTMGTIIEYKVIILI